MRSSPYAPCRATSLPTRALGLFADLVTAQRRDAASALEIAPDHPERAHRNGPTASPMLCGPGARTPARVLSSMARRHRRGHPPQATIGRRVFIDHATGVVISPNGRVDNVVIFPRVTLGGVAMTPVKAPPHRRRPRHDRCRRKV